MKDKKGKINDWQGFFKEFQNESDRATAILGAAFLEENLGQLIKDFLVDDKKAVNELLHPRTPYAPLATFAAKITAAYCLGLLSEEERDDLRRIKNIRNLFAHNLHGLTFDASEVKKECDKFKISDRLLGDFPHIDLATPRERFTTTVALLLSWMVPRRSKAKSDRRTVVNTLEYAKISVTPDNENEQEVCVNKSIDHSRY